MSEDAKQGAESSDSLNALVLLMRDVIFLALFLILPSSFPTKKYFIPKRKKKISLHKIKRSLIKLTLFTHRINLISKLNK